jgi:tRNA modification GTPase
MSRAQDTIFALSSGAPPAGVAVIRVSGAEVPALLVRLCGKPITPRQPALRSIRNRNGELIDRGLVLYFSAPNSFSGEHCAEFHVHGGRAVINAMLAALADAGLRHAEAGEFSRRAFDNGKLDLVEVEGLADLVSAETEMQRRLAIEQSHGGLSTLYQSWMNRLTRARALIEAELDFPEEDDIPGSISDRVWSVVGEIAAEIRSHLDGHRAAEIIRDGFKVVIAGRPNAGKSSLMNALAKRDVAIVTAIPGTTRDVISVDLDLGGYLVRLVDTAGLRETGDVVEAEGVRRARLSMDDADLVLSLRDVMDTGDFEEIVVDGDVVRIASKADLNPEVDLHDGEIGLSVVTGKGIDSLTKRISSILADRVSHTGMMVARQRQVDLLVETISLLSQCIDNQSLEVEVRSEYLRQASHILGKVTGFVGTEELLDVIFSEFCIGK